MGVHGLWDLLAPVGRRVSVETIAGKRLAIDASIWIVQFMKAMRDERGEMVRNAHLLGFFRRICKLLFLRTKPVFVFDGGTPALKRRTVVARRRQREDAQAKIRKTAEKLLLNQLKTVRVKELAKELKRPGGKKETRDEKAVLDEATFAAEKDAGLNFSAEKDAGLNFSGEKDTGSESFNQEALDEMLAASLAAEEHGEHRTEDFASTSASGDVIDDDDDDEILLPLIDGDIDPTVLATLPPSMQLDLLVQMRERLMAENRQKYQKVKKAPQKFSELQIQSYLKTVAFRREIDEVQKAAAGKGVGGVQTARIASEADKEFIFSSSFTGDKHVLASAAVKKQNEAAAQGFSSDVASMLASAKKSSIASVSSQGETATSFGNDVHTYLDERGHTRVSRLRAMGIRMTRDLERNLGLMKESEQENIPANSVAGASSEVSGGKLVSDNIFELNGDKLFPDSENCDQSVSGVNNGITLEISFEDNEQHKLVDGNDDLFAHLVAGSPVLLSSADDALQKAQDVGLDSDCEWEEGNIEELVGNTHHVSDMKPSQVEASNDNKEAELQGQDRISNVCAEVAAACPPENLRHKSRGFLEEEAALKEAMRRSLEDLEVGCKTDSSNDMKKADKFVHMAPPNPVSLNNEISQSRSHNGLVVVGTSSSIVHQNKLSDGISKTKDAHTSNSSELRSMLCANVTGGTTEVKNIGLSRSPSVSIDAGDTPCERNCYAPRLSSQTEICTGSALSDSGQLTLKHKGQNESEVSLMCDSSKAPAITNQEEYMKEPSLYRDVNVKVADVELFDHQERASNIGLHGSAFDESGATEVPGTSLDDELQFLSEEFINLENEQRKLERNADSVNSEMFVECQELLQMFGLPYIIAPMEAEAQCAYMEITGLVDGVVTDDSDVFLFGARSVYKNIFDERKYVETYFMKDIESELGLTHEKLIRMAMLLGSDYTEGVSGIGIVNAIEVMTAFPEEDGLSKFREWVESPDPTILDNLDIHSGSSSKKKASMNVSKSSTKTLSADGDDVKIINDKQNLDDISEIKKIFMNKHRNVSKNWHIPSTFPSSSVVSAYISPQVDKSTEPFSWGKPDLFLLRRLSWEKFGWGNEKVNELLLPVLKEYSKQETQMRLEAFYSFNEKFAKIRSKRIKKAVKGLRGNPPVVVMDDTEVNDHRSDINKATVTEEGASTDVNKTSKGPRKRRAEKIPSETTKMKRQREKPGTCGSARISGRKQESTSAAGSRKRGAIHVSQIHNTATSNAEHATQDENPHQDESFERSMCPEEDAIYADSYNEADETINILSDDNQKRVNNEIKQQESLGGQSFVRDDNYVDSSTIVNQTSEEYLIDEGCGDCSLTEGQFRADEIVTDREKDEGEVDFSYLEIGGGFCSDDNDFVAEEGKETKDSDNYLETGGGFCNDEDDDIGAEERKEIDDSDEASLSRPSPPAPVSSCIESDTKFERARGRSKRPRSEESEERKVDSSSVKAFSAMPYLRRKKKPGS